MSRHTYPCVLRWGDMDAQGHVNNGAYLDYLQEARVHFLLTGPPTMQAMLDSGVLVVSHQLEYLKAVVYGDDPLRIELWVDSVGASRFALGYEAFDGDVLVMRARTSAVTFDLATNRLRRLTQEERGFLAGAVAPAAPLRTLPAVQMGGNAQIIPLAVRWSDLDAYGHVNNVKYFDFVQESRIALIKTTLGEEPEGGGLPGGTWTVARQDIEYLRPVDFRLTPYEVGSEVAAIGNRSFTLAVEIRDPVTRLVYARAMTVVVGEHPLTQGQRAALERWGPGAAAIA